MFTPYSVQCFTPRTGLPTGNTPLGNRIHYVVKVLPCLAFRVGEPDWREPLVACSAYYRWARSRSVAAGDSLYSAHFSILPTILGYLLRIKSYCSLLAHPFALESYTCKFTQGWDSLLTSYPPRRQVLSQEYSGGLDGVCIRRAIVVKSIAQGLGWF